MAAGVHRSPPVIAVRVAAIAAAAFAIAARPAPAAAGDPDAGTIVGLGFGPGAVVTGALADHFQAAGGTGRLRLGGRVGRVGYEITTSFAALTGGDLEYPSYVLSTPSIAYYPLASPHLQMSVRAGLGYGAIGGDRPGPAPPCFDDAEPCPGPTTESISYPGYGLDLGANLQLHLGRRRGGRAVLWADVGVSMVRFQLADEVVAGRVVLLTIGIAHGMEF